MNWSKFFLGISILLLISLWIFTIVTQQHLPETIPVHFDFEGNPDAFGDKTTNWMLPVIATFLFGLLIYTYFNTNSPLLNVSDEMRQNKPFTQLFISIMSSIVMLLFLSIEFSSYQVAMGKEDSLGFIFFICFGLLFATIIGFMVYTNSDKYKKTLQQKS